MVFRKNRLTVVCCIQWGRGGEVTLFRLCVSPFKAPRYPRVLPTETHKNLYIFLHTFCVCVCVCVCV
jgi:hypothetical protein